MTHTEWATKQCDRIINRYEVRPGDKISIARIQEATLATLLVMTLQLGALIDVVEHDKQKTGGDLPSTISPQNE